MKILEFIINIRIALLAKKIQHQTYNKYKSDIDIQQIEEYLLYKKTRQAKGVVYTCTTNDYDDIHEIEIYKYIDKDWDYVFFTDNEEHIKQGQIGIWEVRPLQFTELDNTRNQRWHKVNAHKLFANYEKSIWIDGNVVNLSDYIFRVANNLSDTEVIKIPKHFKNNCIYQEYKDVLKLELDKKDLIDKELDLIKQAGMPRNYGFTETNILIRRHNSQNMTQLQEEWWSFIEKYSKRDQLALMYLLWKYNIKTRDVLIKNTRLDAKDFYVMAHKKARTPIYAIDKQE